MFSEDILNLCRYRFSKAADFLRDAEETLKFEMYETAANRSYYSIFHSVRGLLALDEKDFKKHSAVIAYFQATYIKTGLLPVELSDILKSAFSLRTESDYKDFFGLPRKMLFARYRKRGSFLKQSEILQRKGSRPLNPRSMPFPLQGRH